MAKYTITTLIDDMDGSEADQTVTFGIDGKHYEIDLNTEHGELLRNSLAPFVASARKASGSLRTRSVTATSFVQPRRAAASEKLVKEETDKIREWARAHGHKVADRGRVPNLVLAAYEKRDQGEAEKIDDQLRTAEDTVKNTPPLATAEGQRDAALAADELLSGKAKPAVITTPTVVADPFKPAGQPVKPKRHPRAECEDRDACPQHSGVTPISRAGKGSRARQVTVAQPEQKRA